MSMFQADMAFALGLIALSLGIFVVTWLRAHPEHTCKGGKFLAHLVIILAILTLLCTAYYTTIYWFAGYFDHPTVATQKAPCMHKTTAPMKTLTPAIQQNSQQNPTLITPMSKQQNQTTTQNQTTQPMMGQQQMPNQSQMPNQQQNQMNNGQATQNQQPTTQNNQADSMQQRQLQIENIQQQPISS